MQVGCFTKEIKAPFSFDTSDCIASVQLVKRIDGNIIKVEIPNAKIKGEVECYTYDLMIDKDLKYHIPQIKNVIFNNPYTIVFWTDGTKTTVTCGEGDVWDEEKGIALAFIKKLYGNKGSYIDNIKPFLSENVEKEKARLAEEKKRLDDEAKAKEEKRKQRHIKNLAKKRMRNWKHEQEVNKAMRSLDGYEAKVMTEALEKVSSSMLQCGKSFNTVVNNIVETPQPEKEEPVDANS